MGGSHKILITTMKFIFFLVFSALTLSIALLKPTAAYACDCSSACATFDSDRCSSCYDSCNNNQPSPPPACTPPDCNGVCIGNSNINSCGSVTAHVIGLGFKTGRIFFAGQPASDLIAMLTAGLRTIAVPSETAFTDEELIVAVAAIYNVPTHGRVL